MAYQNKPFVFEESEGIKYYCACGESANKPYCDGSHERLGVGAKSPTQCVIDETKQVAICDCGKTGNAPFCDGTHSK